MHLIHRGAVPLPLIGATADAVESGLDFECRAHDFTLREGERELLTPTGLVTGVNRKQLLSIFIILIAPAAFQRKLS